MQTTEEEFLKKADELGIIYTDAFEHGFNEELAECIIRATEENSTPEKMEEYKLHIEGSKMFEDTYCHMCQYEKCPGYLPDCPCFDYENFLQEHKEEILKKLEIN